MRSSARECFASGSLSTGCKTGPVAGYLYLDTERREALALVPTGAKRVLDVGCGHGGFGAALKRERPRTEVWGIEVNHTAAAVASERLDRVLRTPFPGAVGAERFDVVSFLDVLEHMADPWEALEHTKRLLAPDGLVVASIPNVRHFHVSLPLLFRGRWVYDTSGIMDRTHLRFFTRQTIIDLFSTSGYDLLSLAPLVSSELTFGAKRWWLLRPLPASIRVELTTIQYGVVARPHASTG